MRTDAENRRMGGAVLRHARSLYQYLAKYMANKLRQSCRTTFIWDSLTEREREREEGRSRPKEQRVAVPLFRTRMHAYEGPSLLLHQQASSSAPCPCKPTEHLLCIYLLYARHVRYQDIHPPPPSSLSSFYTLAFSGDASCCCHPLRPLRYRCRRRGGARQRRLRLAGESSDRSHSPCDPVHPRDAAPQGTAGPSLCRGVVQVRRGGECGCQDQRKQIDRGGRFSGFSGMEARHPRFCRRSLFLFGAAWFGFRCYGGIGCGG